MMYIFFIINNTNSNYLLYSDTKAQELVKSYK